MRLRVLHETVYEYAPSVANAQHIAHLRPLDLPHQQMLRHVLRIDPEPSQCAQVADVFGNEKTFFCLPFAHDTLRVRAESVVRTQTPACAECDAPGLPWEVVRDRMRYARGAAYEPAAEFCFPSTHAPRHGDFTAYARPSFAAHRPLMDAARDLMARIHADFAYEPAATDVSTPALRALALRKGVCQDFAHVMVACLRALGLPARYVSGYLLTAPAPGQPRLVGSDASHAWVSVWSPAISGVAAEGAWCDLDPTNDRALGEDYVTLAVGRDYADVSPLRGVIHGGERHVLRVGVTVEPADGDDAAPATPVR